MGPNCAIYSPRKLTLQVLDSIDAALDSVSAPLHRTRRGRVWDCWIDGCPVSVQIDDTASVLWDCDAELRELGFSPANIPFRVVLAAGCNAGRDRQVLSSLAVEIGRIIDGIVMPLEK